MGKFRQFPLASLLLVLNHPLSVFHVAFMGRKNSVYLTDRQNSGHQRGNMPVNLGRLCGCLLVLPAELTQLKGSRLPLSILSIKILVLWGQVTPGF